MSRHTLILNGANRDRAVAGVRAAPAGYVLELREATRSDLQNAALWSLLAQVARQRPTHNGVRMDRENWKSVFMQALGVELTMLPNLDCTGYFVAGHRSSKLTKGEFADLLTLILAWCAKEGLVIEHFDEPEQVSSAARAPATAKNGAGEAVA